MFSTQGNAIRNQSIVDTECLQICDDLCGIGGGAKAFRISEDKQTMNTMLQVSAISGKCQVGEVKFSEMGLVGDNYVTEVVIKLRNILM